MNSKVTATFESWVRYYYDSFRLTGMTVAEVDAGFTVEGFEHVEAAMAEDEVGPVLALPHSAGGSGPRVDPRVQVAPRRRRREARAAGAVRVVRRVRAALGMNIIPLGPNGRDDVAAAAANNGDRLPAVRPRPRPASGVRGRVLRREDDVARRPGHLALRGGAPSLPPRCTSAEGGVHGVVRPPIETSGRRATASATTSRAITQELAHRARGADPAGPEQWHLLQPNWPSDFDAWASRRMSGGDRRARRMVCPYSLTRARWRAGAGARPRRARCASAATTVRILGPVRRSASRSRQ